MTTVVVVTGEHPYDPYYPLEVFASEASAAARCAELTEMFLKDVWAIEHNDTPLIPMPEVTVENWSELEEEHSSDGDDDGFGRWFVDMSTYEVKP